MFAHDRRKSGNRGNAYSAYSSSLTDLFISDRPCYHLGEAKSRIAGTNGSDDFPGFCRSADRATSIRSSNRHSLCGGARSCSRSCIAARGAIFYVETARSNRGSDLGDPRLRGHRMTVILLVLHLPPLPININQRLARFPRSDTETPVIGAVRRFWARALVFLSSSRCHARWLLISSPQAVCTGDRGER